MPSKLGVAAVDRALTILEAFRESDSDNGALTLASLASKTGLYKSTILRLLISLENFNYIQQIEDGRYKLGHKVSQLGACYQTSLDLGDTIIPSLEEIVEKVNESASFLVLEGSEQRFEFRVDSQRTIRDHKRVGDTFKLSKGGASAKVFKYFNKLTASSVSSDNFIFFSLGEMDPDIAAIAAPVFDSKNECIGVVSVTGPLYRFSEKTTELIEQVLKKSVPNLSISLGASPEFFKPLLSSVDTNNK